MKNDQSPLMALLSLASIAGNILFTLWILYNGIHEGFQGKTIEKLSYISLMGLLVINAFLLISYSRNKQKNG